MERVCLAKDAKAVRTITAFLPGVPDMDEDENFVAGFILSGVTATATVDLVRDNFTAALWADAAEPSVAAHILINVATKQWKAGSALVDGDIIDAVVLPRGERVRAS